MKIEDLKVGDVISVPMKVSTISLDKAWVDFCLDDGEEQCFTAKQIEYATFISKAPRTKKVKVEYWINIYPNESATFHVNKHLADTWGDDTRIACEHFVKEYEIQV